MRLIDADALPIKFDGHTVSVWKNDLEAAPTINPYEWISVEDRLPKNEQVVLGYTPCDGFMFVGYYVEVEPNSYYKSYWNIITAMRSTKKLTKKVTHWMPLPTPPIVKENDK